MKVLKRTAAEKKYGAACDAARSWAASCELPDLASATPERVSKSYGISATDAASIISKARIQRRV
jgi:hypothetical protein